MKKLYRSADNNYVFGVFGGLGEYFNTDPTLPRLLFVFFLFVTGILPGVLAYLVAALVVPEDPHQVHVIRNNKSGAHSKDTHESNTETSEDSSGKSFEPSPEKNAD